jgi:hypothetical protein
MAWIDDALKLLAAAPVCGYGPNDAGASEPSALAALALVGHGKSDAAQPAGEFLAKIQDSGDGSVGVREDEPTPRWPTSLALLAWLAIDKKWYSGKIARGVRWALSLEGERMKSSNTGHNSMLTAWPWVEGTHSWVEPSALFTIAFKTLGLTDHERTREAVSLLLDRLLPEGGCNYGNTAVLGQLLRPHVQPSGIAMVALAGEQDTNNKIARTLDYLQNSATLETTSASLSWALLGLAAHDQFPANADKLLEAAYQRTMKRDRSPHKVALLALAATRSAGLQPVPGEQTTKKM